MNITQYCCSPELIPIELCGDLARLYRHLGQDSPLQEILPIE